MAELTAVALNCTLKSSDEPSSTQKLIDEFLSALEKEGVEGESVRIADYDIKAGVTSDEGNGDDWPGMRRKVLDADILIIGTPIWLGQPSSVCKRVLERLNAFISEKDDRSRMPSYGRVAAVAVVGNEDGAHHVSAELYQGLADVGFTIPANAVTYWVGEAMGGTDYKDLESGSDAVDSATAMAARNCAHLAALLKEEPYPGA